jgi:hypothetical protein
MSQEVQPSPVTSNSLLSPCHPRLQLGTPPKGPLAAAEAAHRGDVQAIEEDRVDLEEIAGQQAIYLSAPPYLPGQPARGLPATLLTAFNPAMYLRCTCHRLHVSLRLNPGTELLHGSRTGDPIGSFWKGKGSSGQESQEVFS